MAQWRAGRVVDTAEFRQTHEGHQALIKRLKGLTVARVVLEATGVYYLDLAVALQRAGLPVAVINPRSFHHFAQLKLSNSKTDAADAALLAEYGECMKPCPVAGARRHPDGPARHRATDQPPDRSSHPGQESATCPALEVIYLTLACRR
ncbi:IS110 family transposase [Stutzerimonas kunmingensis]|uniref:IS110 family transposase n=1 Tax=Stutzerimonas kunmingensis TaxID=1211807 RepID=UPI001E4448D3|nr:transposase [Stutzerimonas kunmingensis]MCQ2039326.1 transposase [Stutzerimonas kunmingensis]MCQ2044055.1 transposase [Stutzerimonas kunmingensis]